MLTYFDPDHNCIHDKVTSRMGPFVSGYGATNKRRW